MFKSDKNMLPSVTNEMFIQNTRIHSYNIRQAQLLHVPIAKTNILSKSIRHRGVTIWNYVMKHLPTHATINCFKRQWKRYILENDPKIITID